MQLSGGNKENGFVDRIEEIEIIQDALKALTEKDVVLATPILNFFGVDGIGKTEILQKTILLCQEQNIPYIDLDMVRGIESQPQEIIEDVRRYTGQQGSQGRQGRKVSYELAIKALKRLMKSSPVVILCDSVDVMRSDMFQWIRSLLRELLENTNICVILGSKQKVVFERDWSMARKLKTYQVKPLNRQFSLEYLNVHRGDLFSEESREIVFQWTRGYPLAMRIMVEEVKEKGLDIEGSAEDQQELIAILMKRVIEERVLKNVKEYEPSWYRAYFSLLSMPRRFNLIIMQRLLETFQESPVAVARDILEYVGLPKKLNTGTDILRWDLQKTGFAVEEPVRNLFLLERRIQNPKSFIKIHRFFCNAKSVIDLGSF